jgi:hypothetical protein
MTDFQIVLILIAVALGFSGYLALCARVAR